MATKAWKKRRQVKRALGIREWLYFTTFRTSLKPYPDRTVFFERRVDAVTDTFQREIHGVWQGRMSGNSASPIAVPWANDLYAR